MHIPVHLRLTFTTPWTSTPARKLLAALIDNRLRGAANTILHTT
jgi:hypothetical protein